MATETAASDHASTTDEQYVKKEKDEAIAQMITSLANEDEVKHDKPENTPSSKTEEDQVKAELAAVEVEKPDNSPALEDSLKRDKVEDGQTPTPPTEGDDQKVEPDVAVEKTEDSVLSDASVAVEDNVKEEKELVPNSHTINDTEPVHDAANIQPDEAPSTESIVKETPAQQLEKETVETGEEKEVQSKTEDIPEASTETIDKSSNTDDANPLTVSEGEVVNEAQVLETSAQVEEKPEPVTSAQVGDKPEPVATPVQEKTEEPEKEMQEAEQPSTVAVPEPSDEADEKPNDAIEEKATGPSENVEEETKNNEAVPTETVEAELVVTEGEENQEPVQTNEAGLTETVEAESVVTEVHETPEPVKTNEARPTETVEAEPVVTEVDENPEPVKTNEAGPTETVEAEPVVTEVDENQKEPEKQALEQSEEEKPDTSAIPEHSAESSDTIEEKAREQDFEADKLKETDNFETEKAEPVAAKVDESQGEPEKQEEEEQPKTVVPETEAESSEQQGNIVEAQPPKDSDIDVVKETSNLELEAVPGEIEKPESVSIEVEEKPTEQRQVGEEVEEVSKDVEVVKETSNSKLEAVPREIEKPEPVSSEVEENSGEQLQVGQEVGEVSNDVKTKEAIVLETSKSEGTSDDMIKEEKTDKEEETSLTVNAAQVTSNEEPQANLVEPSPEVAEKVVEEDDKKESNVTDVIEGVSNEAAGIIKGPEQVSTDQEAKAGQKEEREYSVPAAVEEKVVVDVAANDDDKKEPEASNAVPGSSTEVEVESKKVEEQNEAKTATIEAEESVRDDNGSLVVDDKKEGNTDTKVDEISRAISEPLRETLASKFQEKEDESVDTGVDKLEKEQAVEPEKTKVEATKESDATKISKDLPKETPAKPAQKQSNNIISKVKQSLVKAKKAITGKSPSSKNLSSEPKGDIKVK